MKNNLADFMEILEISNPQNDINNTIDRLSNLKTFNDFPNNLLEIIKKDYKLVNKIIEALKNEFIEIIKKCSYDDAIDKVLKTDNEAKNKKKEYLEFIKFKNIIFDYLKTENFFEIIYEENKNNKTNEEIIEEIKELKEEENKTNQQIKRFEFRENQYAAIQKLEDDKGLETGIHCQATGCGKTIIILYYIDYVRKQYEELNKAKSLEVSSESKSKVNLDNTLEDKKNKKNKESKDSKNLSKKNFEANSENTSKNPKENNTIKYPKIILFTERVNILSDLFNFNKKKTSNNELDRNEEKIKYWKDNKICDLTKFKIIDRVLNKTKDWKDLIVKSNEPTLLVINRAYLTQDNLYNTFNKGDISLVIHDECHNATSNKCFDFLTKCKNLEIPIVGFSATPLRTGKDEKTKLLRIFSKKDNPNELNLLTDYNMINAISKKLIVEPEFYWYTIDKSDINSDDDINENEFESVIEVLKQVIPKMKNKKIIVWCRTKTNTKNWKDKFEKSNHEVLKDFTFGIDTSETKNDDYKLFKSKKEKCMLFCAEKHREGSDIKYLDACLFLDRVKDRNPIPFIQSIGRVLRICNETNKEKGFVIDGIIKEDNFEEQIAKKIIDYYIALLNILNIEENKDKNYQNKIDILEKLSNVVLKENNKKKGNIKFGININDDKNNIISEDKKEDNNNNKKVENNNLLNKEITIEINCKNLEWKKIEQKYLNIIGDKLELTQEQKMKFEFECLKNYNKNNNFKNKKEYFDKAKIDNKEINPEIKYKNYWTNWYDFLKIDTSKYPLNTQSWIEKVKEKSYKDDQDYMKNCLKDDLPEMPEELYKDQKFGNITNYINRERRRK